VGFLDIEMLDAGWDDLVSSKHDENMEVVIPVADNCQANIRTLSLPASDAVIFPVLINSTV